MFFFFHRLSSCYTHGMTWLAGSKLNPKILVFKLPPFSLLYDSDSIVYQRTITHDDGVCIASYVVPFSRRERA